MRVLRLKQVILEQAVALNHSAEHLALGWRGQERKAMSHHIIKTGKLVSSLMLFGWIISCWLPLPAIAEDISANDIPMLARVTMHKFTFNLPWFGQVESMHAVNIPARAEGLIVRIGAADETEVRQGDMLFILAGSAVESRMTDLQKQLSQAKREIAIAKLNLNLKRNQIRQRLATHEQVNAAENSLSLARAHASNAKQVLASLSVGVRITAPMDGVFTRRRVHIGQYVHVGMLLARIVNAHRIRIRASLFPSHAIKLVGRVAVIHILHGDHIEGRVVATMPEATSEGGVQVWIEGDDIQKLMPGVQVSGVIPVQLESFAAPQSAIARDDAGKAYVFVRHGDAFRKRSVTTGIRDRRWVQIRSGLKGDEQIATQGVYELLYHDFNKNYHAPD